MLLLSWAYLVWEADTGTSRPHVLQSAVRLFFLGLAWAFGLASIFGPLLGPVLFGNADQRPIDDVAGIARTIIVWQDLAFIFGCVALGIGSVVQLLWQEKRVTSVE
jgi:cytochrome c biogenesis protein CcdA